MKDEIKKEMERLAKVYAAENQSYHDSDGDLVDEVWCDGFRARDEIAEKQIEEKDRRIAVLEEALSRLDKLLKRAASLALGLEVGEYKCRKCLEYKLEGKFGLRDKE